jgi:hypothetical protein
MCVIVHHGLVLWPPRTPDLTPINLLCLRYAKNYIYKNKIQDVKNLNARIRDAVKQATRNTLRRVQQRSGISIRTIQAHE